MSLSHCWLRPTTTLLSLATTLLLATAAAGGTTREEHKACKLRKFKVQENLGGFGFKGGFVDANVPLTANNSKEVLRDYYARMKNGTTYNCEKPEILEFHQFVDMSSQGGEHTWTAFNSTQLLHLLHNKTLLIIGDSLAEQLFLALDVELQPWFDMSTNATSNGNGTHVSYDFVDAAHTIPLLPISSIRPFAAVRSFKPPFDTVHVQFCKDATLTPWIGRTVDSFCVRPMLANATVIVLAFGAHYKAPDNLATLKEYYEQQHKQNVLLENNALRLRQYIHDHRSDRGQRYDVIWRLQSHTGPIDEYNIIFSKFGGRDMQITLTQHASKRASGWIWDTHGNRTSEWVAKFNGITRVVAQLHGDYLLNHHELSYQLLKHEHDRTLQLAINSNQTMIENDAWILNQRVGIHFDSLHYCSGGLFRAGLLLLQRIVEHIHDCRRGG